LTLVGASGSKVQNFNMKKEEKNEFIRSYG